MLAVSRIIIKPTKGAIIFYSCFSCANVKAKWRRDKIDIRGKQVAVTG